MRNRVVAITLLLSAAAACSAGDSDTSATTAAPGLLTTPSYDFGPTTTFMPDCAPMPSPAELGAILGLPLDDGIVIATGTCEFRGLNDQNRVVTLSLLTDPVDIANFNDLVASVGTTAPLNDPAAPTAMIGPNHQVLAITDRGIYGVVTQVNDSTPQEQYALSAAVLAAWLAMG